MVHRFRKRLHDGELLVGAMMALASSDVAEILVEAGFDWLFIDWEHAAYSVRDIQTILQGAGKDTPGLVRLPAGDEILIKRALDTGAAGIIAPMINTADHARDIVRFSRYAPIGTRGVGLARAHRYGLAFQEYMQTANDDVVVVVMAEHADAVENIEAIAAVPGIDAVFVGPYDLSASLGVTGQVDHIDVVQAIDHVTKTCRKANIPLGIFGISPDGVRPYIEKGYTLIVSGADILFLGQAAKAVVAELRT